MPRFQYPQRPEGFLERLVRLRNFGLPYRDIAAVLSHEYGLALTRNAISGLVFRMKLPALPKPPRIAGPGTPRVRKRYLRRKPPPEQPPPKIVVHRIVHTPPPLPAGSYGFFDLKPSSCRYPTGNGPFLFCGETKADGPYCKEHTKLCFHR